MKRTDITDIWPEATKEQIDRILDIAGADITKVRSEADDLRAQLAKAHGEIEQLRVQPVAPADQELEKKFKAAMEELDGLKKANALREMREAVSKSTGVPASLLTGETEEACKAQAEAIRDYAKPSGYPQLRDGGEVHSTGAAATRDQFADWLDKSLKSD